MRACIYIYYLYLSISISIYLSTDYICRIASSTPLGHWGPWGSHGRAGQAKEDPELQGFFNWQRLKDFEAFGGIRLEDGTGPGGRFGRFGGSVKGGEVTK